MGKPYTEDFKQTIVDLYNHGKSVIELASEYGIGEATIYKWINLKKEILLEGGSITIEEVESLKRENLRLKEECEILKKATAIFARKS